MTWTNCCKSVCITAIVRLALTYRPDQKNGLFSSTELLGLSNQQTVKVVKGLLWSNIHLGTALISACLPTYRPILSKFAHGFASKGLPYKPWFSSKQELNKSKFSLYPIDCSRSQKLRSDQVSSNGDDQELIPGVAKGISHKEIRAKRDDLNPDHIMVQSTVSVV